MAKPEKPEKPQELRQYTELVERRVEAKRQAELQVDEEARSLGVKMSLVRRAERMEQLTGELMAEQG